MSGDKIRNKKKIDQEYLDEILSMRNMGAVINKKIEVTGDNKIITLSNRTWL